MDDDASVRKALGRLLRSAGMASEIFDGAAAFFQSLSDHAPDCLLLDVRMPDMSGEEVLDRLSSMECRVPVIVITAYDEDELRLRARFGQTVGFRHKPVNDDALLRDIRNAVQSNRE